MEFESLVARGQETSAGINALRGAGVLTPRGRPARDLSMAVAAVTEPVCLLQVAVGGANAQLLHQVWLSTSAAALLLDIGDGRYDLFTTAPDSVPAAIARLGRLGPRASAERSSGVVASSVLEALWQPERQPRLQALERLGGRRDRWAWRAEMAWPTGGGHVEGRSVTAMVGPEGWWLVRDEDGDDCTMIPTRPTALWLLVIDLMPTDAELDQIEFALNHLQ